MIRVLSGVNCPTFVTNTVLKARDRNLKKPLTNHIQTLAFAYEISFQIPVYETERDISINC